MKKFQLSLVIPFLFISHAFAGDLCPLQTPVNDSYASSQDTPIVKSASEGVLVNDLSDNGVKEVDFSNSGLVLPMHGTLDIKADGSFTYTPFSSYFGPDVFRYQTNNGCTHSDGLATVDITITPKNTLPTISISGVDPLYLSIGDDLPHDVSATDTEDGDLTLQIQTSSKPQFDKNTSGKYTITYTVNDKLNASVSMDRTVYVGAQTENTEELCTNGKDDDFDGFIDKDDSKCKSFYNTAPTITLLGDNPKNIFVGDKYVEAGANANDTEDGAIASSSIKISGTVGTITGTYSLVYSVQDSGNLFAYATRTVIIATTTEDTATKCSDGIDNDGDGKVDVADSDCAAFVKTSTPAPSSGGGGGGGGGGSYVPAINNSTTTATTTTSTASIKPTGKVLGAETSCGIYLNLGKDYLARRHKNDPAKVILLKKFLNENLGMNMELNEFYGPITEKAVKSFQLKYKDKILTPWGIQAPTGKVYLTTVNYINFLQCPSLSFSLPKNSLVPIVQ